jgi:hypothetical protein
MIEDFIVEFEKENNIQFSTEDKEKIIIGSQRIERIYSEFIEPMKKQGYELFSENEFLSDFYGHKLTTKIDSLLLKRGSAIILDYKTGANNNSEYYKEQLALYKYAISKIYTIPDLEIETKIGFLLAPVVGNDLKEFLVNAPVERLEFLDFLKSTLETIKEIESHPETKPTLSRMCVYCEFKSMCDTYIITEGKY